VPRRTLHLQTSNPNHQKWTALQSAIEACVPQKRPPISKGRCIGRAKNVLAGIAKEGREYGLSLCLVSQRPSELAPSVLSQCKTSFFFRINSLRDQDIIQGTVADSASGLLDFLPLVVIGDAVSYPLRPAARRSVSPKHDGPLLKSMAEGTCRQDVCPRRGGTLAHTPALNRPQDRTAGAPRAYLTSRSELDEGCTSLARRALAHAEFMVIA